MVESYKSGLAFRIGPSSGISLTLFLRRRQRWGN